MITYLLKSGTLLLVFYTIYRLLLKNEKMLRFNRIYLLVSLVFSLLIPLQLISFKSSTPSKLKFVQLDEIAIQKSSQNLTSFVENLNLNNVILSIYAIVVLALTIRFIMNLFSLYNKATKNEVQFVKGEKIVLINEPVLPHSFWNTIFINKGEFEDGKISAELIAHEKAHLDQKHTLDILFIEILQIIFWFNPLIIFYKRALKLNHEFLADEAVNNQFGEVTKYQSLLLEIATNKTNITLASNINYLITKKRFLMMTKKESPTRIVFKAVGIGIISIVILVVFSTNGNAQESNTKDQNEIVKNLADVEVKPTYPGGIENFYKLFSENFQTPKTPDNIKVKGKVFVSFIIEKDGSLSELKIMRDAFGYGAGEEALRVLKLLPRWNPGQSQGMPVRIRYQLPISVQSK